MRSGIVVGAFCYKWVLSVISIYPIRLKDVGLLTPGQVLGKPATVLHDGAQSPIGDPWVSSFLTSQLMGSGHLGVQTCGHWWFLGSLLMCVGGLSIFCPAHRRNTIMMNRTHSYPFPPPATPELIAILAIGSQGDRWAGLHLIPTSWFFFFSNLRNEVTWSLWG